MSCTTMLHPLYPQVYITMKLASKRFHAVAVSGPVSGPLGVTPLALFVWSVKPAPVSYTHLDVYKRQN